MTNNNTGTVQTRRPLLWTGLAISLAVNGTTSVLGAPLAVSVFFGVLALIFAVALFLGRDKR
ncbi:hypothetical protein SAMN05216553_101359 [Lentzea fradiae]|uniref:Uncharacterized protein n=1 Tax=Lentzea fradiae TaxID=200378 RepID=A0A1G7KLK4_9PSEU|nr:hypothetical protein [Lentzea fradiae]SDF38092.1 hypothetical protein SAMN05216553_101359 [Lentzea fradiae]